MKKARWLCALVLGVCLALGLGVAVTASADGALSVGSISVAAGLDINGTTDGKTEISFTNANQLQATVDISNYVNEAIDIKLISDADVRVRIALLDASWSSIGVWEDGLGQWDAKSITAGTEATIHSSGYTTGTTAANYHLCIYFYDTGTVTINSLKVGDVSYTPATYVPPQEATDTVLKEYTEWTHSSNVTIAENTIDKTLTMDGITDGIATVTFSDTTGEAFEDTVTGETANNVTYFAIPIDGVPTGWNNIYVKYKATSGIEAIEAYMNEIVVANQNPNADLQGKKVYICTNVFGGTYNVNVFDAQTEGYKLSAIDISSYLSKTDEKTALVFSVKFAAGAVAAEQKIEFGGIAFANTKPAFATDDPSMTIIGDLTQNAKRFTIEKDGTDIVISWALKLANDYDFVNVPVTNWHSTDRFLKFVFTADKDFTMAVYVGDSNIVSGHTMYKGGIEQTVYIDTTKASGGAIAEGDIAFRLYLDTEGESLAKVLRIKSIELVDTAVAEAPKASDLTIDYAAETVSFDAEKIAVYTDQGTTAIESGAKVTPSAKLYMRTKASEGYTESALAEFAVPARPEAESVTATATTDKITIAKDGYSFKIEGGEWTTTGEFTGLTASTEYTVTYRKDATSTSFASEEKTLKVTTKAAASTGDGDKDDDKTEEPATKKGCKNAVSGGALYAFLTVCGAAVVLGGVKLAKKSKKD